MGLYHYQKVAVFCTQATHRLQVYQQIHQELQLKGELYTIPTPELVPLIEAKELDYDQIYATIDRYKAAILAGTDALILGCTHYPIVLDIFWEQFPQLKIIDPGRSTIFTLDKRISQALVKKEDGI